jgi:pentatricopeptide repeat protein
MESRYEQGDTNAKPNEISYTLAMKTCFQAGDLVKADAIMKRMEKSDTPPDIRTYSDILLHYSHMGTTAAAERTEQILAYMTELGRSVPLLRPNIYSYSIALNAWASSGDANAADRMWAIYEQTKREKVPMDSVFSTALITFLSKMKRRTSMQRALEILRGGI